MARREGRAILCTGLAPEAVAIAEAVEMANAVMMHTDADANRADLNADAGGRSANRGQRNHSGDERRLENVFHFLVLSSLKPSRGGRTSACIIRCGKFRRLKAAAIPAKLGHGRKSMVNHCLTKTSLAARLLLAFVRGRPRGGT